jgi:hypothetical protein
MSIIYNSQTNENLTNQVREDLKEVREDQRFEPLLFVDPNIPHPTCNKLLIIQLNKSYDQATFGLLVYKDEIHILGKALRLLIHLQDECNIYNYILRNDIARILVTDAYDIASADDSNKWVFETESSKKTVGELIGIRNWDYNTFEQTLQALVLENTIN